MGLQYTRKGSGSLDGSSYRAMAHDMMLIINEQLAIVGEEGVKEGHKAIHQADTHRQWQPGPWGETGTGDRIDTGKMYQAVDYRIFRGPSVVGLDVGWPGVYKKYFTAQDQGFDALGFRRPSSSGSDHVAGIGMISHLEFYLRGKVDEAIDIALKRIVEGL